MIQLEKSEENILYFKKFIDDYCANGLDVKKIEELLYYFQPLDFENNRLVDIIVDEKSKNLPRFSTIDVCLKINIVGLVKYVKKIQMIASLLDKKNIEQRFTAYMILYVLIHEIAHSYQFCMGEKKLESPCKLVSEGYKTIFNIATFPEKDRYNIGLKRYVSFLKYYNNSGNLILERNANIEASYLIEELAKNCEEDKVFSFFAQHRKVYQMEGYEKSVRGCMEETFNKLKLQDLYAKFDHSINLSMEDRVRYGLQIDEETRKKVLSLDEFKVKK